MNHSKKEEPSKGKPSTSEENKTPGFSEKNIRQGAGKPGKENKEEDIDTSESDVTKDDLQALGPVDLSMDGGDDEDLAHRPHPVDFSGDELDVPGAELDDDEEKLGSEDEENNSYSLGNNN